MICDTSTADSAWLAHSAPSAGAPGDPYARHIVAVRAGAQDRAAGMLRFARDPPPGLLTAINSAATFHDVGKLDPEIQAALHRGRQERLRWDHIDAGVAQLSAKQNWMAAWIVRAHHAPGLPRKQDHFDVDGIGHKLRGRRHDGDEPSHHIEQIRRTDACLAQYLAAHESLLGTTEVEPCRPVHGLTMRLALSCVVDADHNDTAFAETGHAFATPPPPRWDERFESLCRYVRELPVGDTAAERDRNARRSRFFEACTRASRMGPIVACEAPVGLGKTTAVAAYLLRRASERGLRRLIIVAPYTNILFDVARRLRKALVLEGERADEVIVEHHHRAEFESYHDREASVLWRAPIVLTTAVSFFETLAGCAPSKLRKLHEVPGSAIFIDEAHAALPAKLWPQNWRWLRELSENWGCEIALCSGSLVRFWEDPDVVGQNYVVRLPELLPRDQAKEIHAAERGRIRYVQTFDDGVLDTARLIEKVKATPGPRLVILNTVQNAAVVAKAMHDVGIAVFHVSTALTPTDRARVLERIEQRLRKPTVQDWAVVATSCLEAGIDFSFRSGFRERFSTASIIQTGGRVNRNAEFDTDGGGVVFDFALEGPGVTEHPAAAVAADVLAKLMAEGRLNLGRPADLVTAAMHRELALRGGIGADPLIKAEQFRDYPAVQKHGRVIDADTRLVVVDSRLKSLLAHRRRVSFRRLLRGSVQLWATKIERLGLARIPSHEELYSWNADYDPDLLGYMSGVLSNYRFLAEGGAVI